MSTNSEKGSKKPAKNEDSTDESGEPNKTKDLPYIGRPNNEGRSRPAVILGQLKAEKDTPQ